MGNAADVLPVGCRDRTVKEVDDLHMCNSDVQCQIDSVTSTSMHMLCMCHVLLA